MKPRNHSRKGDLPPCDALSEDDGVDPRTYFDRRLPGERNDRRSRMLCSQVAERLHLVLRGDCSDPDLADVELESVEPHPDSSRPLVTLCVPDDSDLEAARRAIARAAPTLRTEVAAAVHRRRVPDLVFECVQEPESWVTRPS